VADSSDSPADTGMKWYNPFYMRYAPDELGNFNGQSGYGYVSFEKFIDGVEAVNGGMGVEELDKRGLPTLANTIMTTAILEAGRRSLDGGMRGVKISRNGDGTGCRGRRRHEIEKQSEIYHIEDQIQKIKYWLDSIFSPTYSIDFCRYLTPQHPSTSGHSNVQVWHLFEFLQAPEHLIRTSQYIHLPHKIKYLTMNQCLLPMRSSPHLHANKVDNMMQQVTTHPKRHRYIKRRHIAVGCE
jgi:hypothetical protein